MCPPGTWALTKLFNVCQGDIPHQPLEPSQNCSIWCSTVPTSPFKPHTTELCLKMATGPLHPHTTQLEDYKGIESSLATNYSKNYRTSKHKCLNFKIYTLNSIQCPGGGESLDCHISFLIKRKNWLERRNLEQLAKGQSEPLSSSHFSLPYPGSCHDDSGCWPEKFQKLYLNCKLPGSYNNDIIRRSHLPCGRRYGLMCKPVTLITGVREHFRFETLLGRQEQYRLPPNVQRLIGGPEKVPQCFLVHSPKGLATGVHELAKSEHPNPLLYTSHFILHPLYIYIINIVSCLLY